MNHYLALLDYAGKSSLPEYFAFNEGERAIYDYWADELEKGLLTVTGWTEDEMYDYVKDFTDNNKDKLFDV